MQYIHYFCVNYENVVTLKMYLKIFVQCLQMQWRFIHVNCGLKVFKMMTETYPTKLALEDYLIWMKKFWKRLLNWILIKAPEIWCQNIYHVQLCSNISDELRKWAKMGLGFLKSFHLRTRRNFPPSAVIFFFKPGIPTFHFLIILLHMKKNGSCMSTEKWEAGANINN